LVPPALEVVNGVGAVPGEQSAEMAEQRSAVAVLVDQSQVGHAVVAGVANVHVEQHPGDVALDRVARLEAVGIAPGGAIGMCELALVEVEVAAVIRAAEEIADRMKCEDFATFEPLFAEVRDDIRTGRRKTRRYAKMAGIKQGEFFIVNGQIAYVAEAGEEFETKYERRDSRLRVIYDNGTESDILLRSLQRALHRDESGRRITDPDAGPLFSDEIDAPGTETGTVYVLRSMSDHPDIVQKRDIIHKIGVTGGDVEKRMVMAERDPTFLMAPVKIIATYRLVDINRTALRTCCTAFSRMRASLSRFEIGSEK
jgi:hypothetical protein